MTVHACGAPLDPNVKFPAELVEPVATPVVVPHEVNVGTALLLSQFKATGVADQAGKFAPVPELIRTDPTAALAIDCSAEVAVPPLTTRASADSDDTPVVTRFDGSE